MHKLPKHSWPEEVRRNEQSRKVVFLLICAIVGVVFLITGPRVLGTATNVITMRAQYNQTGVLNLDVNNPELAGIGEIRENVDAEGNYVGPPLKEGEMPILKMVLMLLVAIYGLSAFFTYLQQKITAQVAQRAMFDLRENVDRKIQMYCHARRRILKRYRLHSSKS